MGRKILFKTKSSKYTLLYLTYKMIANIFMCAMLNAYMFLIACLCYNVLVTHLDK